MNQLKAAFTHALQNQFFSGGAVLMVVGSILAYMRGLPHKTWYHILNQTSVTLDIVGTDPAYDWVLVWLNQQPYTSRSRRISVHTSRDGKTVVFTPARGQHVFLYRGIPVWLRRGDKEGAPATTVLERDSESGQFSRRNETIHIRVLGRSQALARSIVSDAREVYEALLGNQSLMYRNSWSSWSAVGTVRHRSLASVVLPGTVAEDLVAGAREYLEAHSWYRDRGIPYRRGWLLHGLPGTGKSSLVAALACELKLPLYSLNLGSTSLTDDNIQELFLSLPDRCLLLLEDIDAAARSRVEPTPGRRRHAPPDHLPVTLSALLNTLDGVGSSEGRLLFMTTNHREALDPALIRPGRVDVEVEFKKATYEQVVRLYRRFYEVDDAAAPLLPRSLEDRFTMAELQGMFLQHREDPEGATRALKAA